MHEDFLRRIRGVTLFAGASWITPLPPTGIDFSSVEESLERYYIEEALRMAGGNESKAARLLNLNHHNFRYRKKITGTIDSVKPVLPHAPFSNSSIVPPQFFTHCSYVNPLRLSAVIVCFRISGQEGFEIHQHSWRFPELLICASNLNHGHL